MYVREGKVRDGVWCSVSLIIEPRHDTERVACATASPEDVWIARVGGMDKRSISEDDVDCDDRIQHEAVLTADVSVATVGRVATNADARARAMRKSTLVLLVDVVGDIAQTDTTTNRGNASGFVDGDLVEVLQEDLHATVLSARAE